MCAGAHVDISVFHIAGTVVIPEILRHEDHPGNPRRGRKGHGGHVRGIPEGRRRDLSAGEVGGGRPVYLPLTAGAAGSRRTISAKY